MTDFIIALRTRRAVKTFSGNLHFSVGAGLSAAAGIVGRGAEDDVHAGVGCYAVVKETCLSLAFRISLLVLSFYV